MALTKWSLDPTHSELQFKIRHLMITNVTGYFSSFEVTAEAEEDDFSTARIRVKADMASISTNNAQRDAHLRNADFFETDTYPELTFTSTRITRADAHTLLIDGDLTLKGVTKPVQLRAEVSGATKDPWGNTRAGFVVTGKISRSDWGVSFNAALETGGVVLGEEVKIAAEIQLIREAVAVEA